MEIEKKHAIHFLFSSPFCMVSFRMCLHIVSALGATLAYFTLIEPLLGSMRLCVTFVAHNLSCGGWRSFSAPRHIWTVIATKRQISGNANPAVLFQST